MDRVARLGNRYGSDASVPRECRGPKRAFHERPPQISAFARGSGAPSYPSPGSAEGGTPFARGAWGEPPQNTLLSFSGWGDPACPVREACFHDGSILPTPTAAPAHVGLMPRKNHELHQRFGKVIRARRKAAGMSQTELALSAGISGSFVSQIERGLRGPTLNTIAGLAEALDVKVSDLLEEIGE